MAGQIGNLEHDELDSTLGDEIQSDTTSLASTIYSHREELGRTYHKFHSENQYWGPNDEQQNNQLDIGHHMLTLLLDNKLYLAPIGDQCQKVIDLGCGTGIWTIDFADAHPEADVVGVDLSPIQPHWVPPNCRFFVDDITDEWTVGEGQFDFVHLRCLFGSVADWKGLYQQIFTRTRPGGWIQQLEMSIQFESDDKTVDDGNFLSEWSKTLLEYGEKVGKTFRTADICGKLIREAGFEDVSEKWYKVPVGTWAKDKRMKEIGFWNYHYCMEGCEGWALYALVKVLGWTMEEAQVFIARFRNELKNKKNHAYYRVVVVWGKRPLMHQ